jgi:trehalose 6-phosphate synthase/phosphatase
MKLSLPVPVESVDAKGRAPLPAHSSEEVSLTIKDRLKLEQLLQDDEHGRIMPVWLYDEKEEGNEEIWFNDQARWRRYAEHDLYTLFHYKQHEPTDGRHERKRWSDYCRLNQAFADRIVEVYKPGDIVWIHDYHLMLLPSLLRQRVPNMYMGFYLHTPFPSSEFLKCLSRRKEILTGVLGANMVGFQTYNYSRHFSSCCTRILGFDAETAGVDSYGAHIAVDVFPIGIDAKSVAKQAFGNERVETTMKRVKEQFGDMKIIIGRDRLDTVRGVAQKLEAYEIFLERYPEWVGKVVLIQVTSPTSIEEEKEDAGHKIAAKISDLVTNINGLYGGLEYTPVHHFPQYLSKNEYFALLRVADLGLITSVRDGMNTTSMEYVLCQRDHCGPLVLSEFSGTAASLTEAIHINPWDLSAVADTIHNALCMPMAERKAQHRALYKHVTQHDVREWARTYLSRLFANLASFNQSIATPSLDRTQLASKYLNSKRRLFMFDYDGTLTPIVKDPQAAIPSDRIVRTIKTLAKDRRNNVWIISGRDQAFLDEWLGHISQLGLSAEHGSFVRQPESDEWENLTEKFDMSWQKEVMEIFNYYTERTQGSFIERKRIALTWHYRRSDPEYGAFQARECKEHMQKTVAKKWDVEVMSGKANLEVRPRFVNKGAIATRLVREYGSGPNEQPDFVLCLGDDFTDEDMFRALRQTDLPKDSVFAVTVGASSKKTLASWHLLEPTDVIATIGVLNGTIPAANAGAGSHVL